MKTCRSEKPASSAYFITSAKSRASRLADQMDSVLNIETDVGVLQTRRVNGVVGERRLEA